MSYIFASAKPSSVLLHILQASQMIGYNESSYVHGGTEPMRYWRTCIREPERQWLFQMFGSVDSLTRNILGGGGRGASQSVCLLLL